MMNAIEMKKSSQPYLNRTPPISMVGHSSGGDVIPPVVEAFKNVQDVKFGTLVKIGSFLKEEERFAFQEVYEVGGTLDVFEGHSSTLSRDHQFIRRDIGHLGLVFDQDVVTYISNLLTHT